MLAGCGSSSSHGRSSTVLGAGVATTSIPATATTSAPATRPLPPVSTVVTKPGPITSPAPAQSGAELFTLATQDAVKVGWLHAEVATTDAGVTSIISQDSGLTSGHQSVTQAGGHLDVILIGSALYLKGDTSGLTELGVTSAEAGRYANMWIAVPSGDSLYANTAEGVTVSSALGQVALSGPISMGSPTEVNGTAVVGLSGEGPGPNGAGTVPETMFVSTGPNPLPVEVTEAASDGSTLKATFSHWGAPVAISAPGGAIPISSIPGAP
jgi:hypothetical protein